MKINGEKIQNLDAVTLWIKAQDIKSPFQSYAINLYNDIPEYVNFLIEDGIRLYCNFMYEDAVQKFFEAEEALSYCKNIYHVVFEDINFYIGKCYLYQSQFYKAKIFLEKCFDGCVNYELIDINDHAKNMFMSCINVPCAENVARFLVYIFHELKEINQKIKEQKMIIVSDNATSFDKIKANLLLGAIYQFLCYTSRLNIENTLVDTTTLKRKFKRVVKFLSKSFKYYSAVFELRQGSLDKDAYVIEQHCIGVSYGKKLGTHNLQQCIAIIAYDPSTKKVALGHFDRLSHPKSIKRILENFAYGSKVNLYLVGARDEHNVKSIGNVTKVLREIVDIDKIWNIDIQSVDLLYKKDLTGNCVDIPSAIVFDSSTGILSHSVPVRYDKYHSHRVAKWYIDIELGGKEEYSSKMYFINFNNVSKIEFTLQEKECLLALVSKNVYFMQHYMSWSSRLLKYHCLRIIVDILPKYLSMCLLESKISVDSRVRYITDNLELGTDMKDQFFYCKDEYRENALLYDNCSMDMVKKKCVFNSITQGKYVWYQFTSTDSNKDKQCDIDFADEKISCPKGIVSELYDVLEQNNVETQDIEMKEGGLSSKFGGMHITKGSLYHKEISLDFGNASKKINVINQDNKQSPKSVVDELSVMQHARNMQLITCL
ncbi:hypothetical protein LUA82_02585 [Neoehrlichia mikurensis]|uniref:Uncharacterized protein n=1 Tax=Neoehrlichia mikurensis TaxID=89586 RepID=A0A9Q9BZC6_9RICK|nr:hypothetical protein [Neoehrlichia mikurensis]QXK92680.1 hypothetical protein HUN61_01520 [Neoehrlichia mikurensis]UTO55079.1 hypothetical protein LUA82_02585 [Neoehrlichia mikurensis]